MSEEGLIRRTKRGTVAYVARVDASGAPVLLVPGGAPTWPRAAFDKVAAHKKNTTDAGDWEFVVNGKAVASFKNRESEPPKAQPTLMSVAEDVRLLRQELGSAKAPA
jgi:hypothetical protein